MFRILPILLSAFALLAGRYYPWRRVTGREPGQAEAVLFGLVAVVGPATLALLDSRHEFHELDEEQIDGIRVIRGRAVTPAECVRVYVDAGIAAGLTVLAAAALDAYVEQRHVIADHEMGAALRREQERIYADYGRLD